MPRLLDEPGEQAGGFPWLPGRTCAYIVMVITAEAVRAHMDQLREAEPDMPVEDRAADTWEPLIAVAELAGGDWPARARKAALALRAEDDTDTTVGARLLGDLRDVFGGAGAMHGQRALNVSGNSSVLL